MINAPLISTPYYGGITQAIIDGDLDLALENYDTIKNACVKIKLQKIHQIYEQKYSKTVDVIKYFVKDSEAILHSVLFCSHVH